MQACSLCGGRAAPMLCSSCANADLSLQWARASKVDEALAGIRSQLSLESASLSRSLRLSRALKRFNIVLAENRRAIEATETRIKQIREANERRRQELARARQELAQAQSHLDNVVLPTVARLAHAAESMEEAVAAERRRRSLELHDVLPMEPGQGGGLVAGVWMTRFDDKERFRQLALALSLVSRAIMIVSAYIGLPLPFRMSLDRGVIRLSRFDDTSQSALLPWDPSFSSAAKMLWRNLATLCAASGVPSNLASPRDLISSMWQVFHSPSLGGSVRQALIDSRAREARNPSVADEPDDFVFI